MRRALAAAPDGAARAALERQAGAALDTRLAGTLLQFCRSVPLQAGP
jgi:hypothetical protein